MKIGIIGAGSVGVTLAHELAGRCRRDRVGARIEQGLAPEQESLELYLAPARE